MRDRLKEASRAAMLDAAEVVFARDGVQRARMEDVAAAAGVAVGTLYNYFADRHALVEALLATRRDELLGELERSVADAAAPFPRRLEAFLATLLGYYQRHAGLFVVKMEAELCTRGPGQGARPTLRPVHELTGRLIADGLEAGALRPEAVELHATLLMGAVRGLFMRHVYGLGDPPTPDTAARLVELFLRGAGAAGGGGR